jgi:hypothetical protein
MFLIDILEASKLMKNKHYPCVQFDFEKNLIHVTDGVALLRIKFNFNVQCNIEQYPNFNNKKQFLLHMSQIKFVVEGLRQNINLFDILANNLIVDSDYRFPPVENIQFRNKGAISNIKYDINVLYTCLAALKKLNIGVVNLNFSWYRELNEPTQILESDNDQVEILLMPAY